MHIRPARVSFALCCSIDINFEAKYLSYEMRILTYSNFFVVLVVFCNLSAQEIDFRQDTTFFKQQLPIYEQWLKDSGLEQVLKVYDIEVKKNGCAMKLGFYYADSDSASVAWFQLKSDFEEADALTLEQRLFYKMTHVMEVPATNAKIYVSDTYDLTKIPCLDGKIYFKEGVIKSTIDFCRSAAKEIHLANFELKETLISSAKKLKSKKLEKLKNRKRIYIVIEKNARRYFEKKGVTFSVLEKNSVFRFEVMNTKLEVFTSSWVDWFNPHELLTFTIKYTPIEDGIAIYCEIDGKYGSGLFKPRSLKGFREMEPEYKVEVKRYTDKFTAEKLTRWLSKDFD